MFRELCTCVALVAAERGAWPGGKEKDARVFDPHSKSGQALPLRACARRHRTLRDRLASSMARARRRVAAPSTARRGVAGRWFLGPAGSFARRGGRRDLRSHWAQRVGQEHAVENPGAHHRAFARLRGRARPRRRLLEIGTGFHMELTGRENVYLSGAILGLRRAEIRSKFAAIVAMAGVDDFLEMPVKRYSTGMYLRLAFSVAAHLDGDILLLDEVLTVGDTAFQRTCQEKIRELANEGRTVVLVSHDLPSVRGAVRSRLAAQGRTGNCNRYAGRSHRRNDLNRGLNLPPLGQVTSHSPAHLGGRRPIAVSPAQASQAGKASQSAAFTWGA